MTSADTFAINWLYAHLFEALPSPSWPPSSWLVELRLRGTWLTDRKVSRKPNGWKPQSLEIRKKNDFLHQKSNGTESQRTPIGKVPTSAIRYSSLGVHSVGPVGDFLDFPGDFGDAPCSGNIDRAIFPFNCDHFSPKVNHSWSIWVWRYDEELWNPLLALHILLIRPYCLEWDVFAHDFHLPKRESNTSHIQRSSTIQKVRRYCHIITASVYMGHKKS